MKRSFTLVCMLGLAMAVGSAVCSGQTAEPPSAPLPAGAAAPAGPSKVAVIGFEQAVVQTNEGRRTFGQIQAKYQPKEVALKSEQDEIDTLKKQLQAAGSTLSQADRESRQRTIDDKTKSLQRELEDDQNDINSEMQEAFNALAQKVGAVLQSYAQQNGYTLVLDGTPQQNTQSPILWFNQGTDITKAVVEAYNVKSGVPPPTATQSAPAATGHPTGTTHTAPRSSTTKPQ
jgi:outer membrane protein